MRRLGIAVLVVVAVACTPATPEETTSPAVPAVLAAVCDAAAADDPGEAEEAFGRAHDGLHTLARELQTDRRQVAATLLEAKQRVEAAFADASPPPDLTARLVTLAEAVGAAVAPPAEPPATCPQETGS